ncbi:MAG: hypothetical protein A2W17_01890 [Planctomycetes bacterium RBG_16_41_13]|nr:MAG: hypothetical protein A2W17_01890 [Planctomycetes bacterium RBG_16_41_13]
MKKLFKESIFIVAITLVFFGLFPLLLFRMLAFPNAKTELEQQVQRNLEEALYKQNDHLSRFWEERRSHARAISDAIQSTMFIYGDEDFVGILSGGNELEYLRLSTQLECTKADYGYKGIFVCDAAGIVHITTADEKPLKGANIMKEDAFRDVQETLYDGKSYISGVSHFPVDKKEDAEEPSLFMSYPIKGERHDIIGAVFLWMNTSLLDTVMDSFALGKTGEAYLINKDGVMVTQSRFSRHHGNETNDTCKTCHIVEDPGTKMMTKGVKSCVTGKASGYNIEGYRDYGGIKVVGTWRWLKDMNMGLMVEIDADEAFSTINNINSMIKSFMIVVIVPAVVLAFLLHRKINLGYMVKGMPLPKKALLGTAFILVVGFIIAILDGYQLKRESGYIREQEYRISNPFSVLGSIAIPREEDFIENNISKFRKEYRIQKSENTFHNEKKESELVKGGNYR